MSGKCFALPLILYTWIGCSVSGSADELTKVGVAKMDVTPTTPVVLAGYGGRTGPYEGIDTKLWARALYIEGDHPVALVVLDSCGITSEITRRVREQVQKECGSKLNVMVATTHTHNAPALIGYAPILWQGRVTAQQQNDSKAYTDLVIKRMTAAIIAAQKKMEPMRLSWAQGRVTFGGNRRVIREGKWQGFGFQLDAPVDHSLPVMLATDRLGKVRAIWANYACHCTTVGSSNRVGGDWAGFANDEIETLFPAAIALTSIGCGADIGPQPSGNLEIARNHGKAIAQEVKDIFDQERMKSLTGSLSVRSEVIQLPLVKPREESHWKSQAQTRGFQKELAIKLLKEIEVNGKIRNSVEYPITSWNFESQLAIVFMPGEVVVDYAVRLKTELDWNRLWLTGWSNRMPGYIPSRKTLLQGGYEADFSQIYYGQPSRYRPEIEDLIVAAVKKTTGDEFLPKPNQPSAPFHKLPSRESLTFASFLAAHGKPTDKDLDTFSKAQRLLKIASPAVGKIDLSSGQRTQWFDLKGDRVDRIFIRQETQDAEIRWSTPKIASVRSNVLCFTGGLGWNGQPKTAGFELELDGDSIQFDVSRTANSWKSKTNDYELFYFPIWTSNEDSAGFFFLIAHTRFKTDHSIDLKIKSIGSGSLRWFGMDLKQETQKNLKKLGSLLSKITGLSDRNQDGKILNDQ